MDYTYCVLNEGKMIIEDTSYQNGDTVVVLRFEHELKNGDIITPDLNATEKYWEKISAPIVKKRKCGSNEPMWEITSNPKLSAGKLVSEGTETLEGRINNNRYRYAECRRIT